MNETLPKIAFRPSSFYYWYKGKVVVLNVDLCTVDCSTVLNVLYVLNERTVVCSVQYSVSGETNVLHTMDELTDNLTTFLLPGAPAPSSSPSPSRWTSWSP